MAWFSLAKIALQAGSKIYANRYFGPHHCVNVGSDVR